MKAKKVIQEFMDLMKKTLHKSSIEKLQAYLQNLSKMSFNKSEAEYLMEAVLQYIDIVINISANKGYRDQIKICKQWMDALQVVITDDVRAVFMKKVTQRIFDILIEEDVNTWCIKKELLRMLLTCVQKSPKEVRNKTAQELPDIYIFKIFDSISIYGDYDFQVILIETVFRLFGRSTILSNLPDLIPESQELTDSFAHINGDTFDEDVRKFLNILNQNSKKVFSVVCRDVFLGKVKCVEPMDNVGGLWVDFNRSENAVSWYTTAESLNQNDNLDESNTGWILVLFFVKDVQLIQIYRPPNSNDAIIYVKLKQPCMVSFEGSVECAKAEDVKFVISCDSNRVKALISQVLPAMFKNKLHNHSLKVSLGKKAVYKPLKVSFRRRTRSDSKSDTSSFSALVNAVSGLNNSSDGSEVHSISSVSTKCDVISISDGSVHSNESSIDLVPSSRKPPRNAKMERSQYETSEMCTSQHSQEVCKISMNRFMSRERNSNNLSFTNGTHNIPEVIRKISERYSGSKSSRATFTPKKKSCPRLEVEKSSTASGNIVEGNSSDRYETAQVDPQNLFDRQGMTSEDVLDGEELRTEDVLERDATISKNKEADLKPKQQDRKFSVSKLSLKSEEQKSKEISLQRNKIELMSQRKEKDQTRNVKDVTRREGYKENLVSFNTEELFAKEILTDIGKHVATPLEENEKPNKDIVIDLESDVESLDVSSREVQPAISKTIAEESQSNVSVIKKGNAEPSPMANENNEKKEVDVLTLGANRFISRGHNSDDISFTDSTHNIRGGIRIISGRYSGSKSSPTTSTHKKKSSLRLQVKKSSTVSGNIIESNSSDQYETAQGVPQSLFDRQGTIREDVLNGDELAQNKRDKLLLLKDVLENNATISKNKEADLKPKLQDEEFSVSKSSLKSEEQKSEERLAGRIFKEISLENNKIKLMSQSKEKEQTRHVKDTREEGNKENLILFNTKDLFPKVILTDVIKYAATTMEVNKKLVKDIVINLESDVENLNVPSQEVLPTVNKSIASESQSKVSVIKKGNAEEASPTENENNEKKEVDTLTIGANRFRSRSRNSDDLSFTDDTHNTPGRINIISGRYSGSKSSPATSIPKKKSFPRLQVEKSSTALGNIVEVNSSDRYETAQGIPQSLFDRQRMTSEDVLDGEELAQNKRDELLLLEDVLENDATISKNKEADLKPKQHDRKFSVSKPSLKFEEQKSKKISLQRKKIELMSQRKEEDQTRKGKDVTRREGDKENLISFNTEDLFPKGILSDIGKYVATPLEENEKPNTDIVIDLESNVESLDVSSREVLPAISKTIAGESQSNISVIKKVNAEVSPTAKENNEKEEVDALTSSVHRFMPRGRYSDDLSSTDSTHNVLGRIRIISGRYSGSKSSTATFKAKKKSSPRLQVEKNSTASGDIVKGNSTDHYETAQGFPQSLSDRQGTTHEDVLNGEEFTANKLDELPLLEDVLENDATISKNKGAEMELKRQDDSKSMLKSEKQKRKERLAGRKIFKRISHERNTIKLMSQSKDKKQTRNVKDKTRQESDKESVVLINTEDLLPKVILTNIGKYFATTQKPNKDVENLDIPSQEVLPAVNKTDARESQSNVSVIKKRNAEELSPTANENNEKKEVDTLTSSVNRFMSRDRNSDDLYSSDGTHYVPEGIRIISGRNSSSKSSPTTSLPKKKLSPRLQVEKSSSASGDIVKRNSSNHSETIQSNTQNPSDRQRTTCEDVLNGEELAQNKLDRLVLLEDVLENEANISKNKGADLEPKWHDEEFSVSNSSPKSKEQKSKEISLQRNKIELMSQRKEKDQTRNVKDVTRQESDKESVVLINTEDLFPKGILTDIRKHVATPLEENGKPNKDIVIDLESDIENLDLPSQEVLPTVNKTIASESQSNLSVIKTENAERPSPTVNEDNEKKEEENGLNKEVDALTLIPNQRENLEYARQLSASTVENNAGENDLDEFMHDHERDFNELRKHQNQTYLSTTLGGSKRRKLYNPDDLTYLENIELFKEKDKEIDKVDPSAKQHEMSIRRKVFRKKQVQDKKPKKLKVVRPHTTLHINKHHEISNLMSTFSELLDAFKKESKTSFLNILTGTAAGTSVKEKKKVIKASKNNFTKVTKKLKTKPKNILIKNECARDLSVSDNSSASLKLMAGEHKCTDDETDLDAPCREKVGYIEPDKKINIISDIQLRPKRTLLQNKSEIQNKKMKNEDNPASDIQDDFCISRHISNNEICNWIETGSPNYNAEISERRTVLKYAYFMSKKALGNPDASQEYQDLLRVCRLLKKYV